MSLPGAIQFNFSITIPTTCLDIHFLICIRKPLAMSPVWQEVPTIFSQHPTSDSAFGSTLKTLSCASITRSLDLLKDAYPTIPHYLTPPPTRNIMLSISTFYFSLYHKCPCLIEVIYLLS